MSKLIAESRFKHYVLVTTIYGLATVVLIALTIGHVYLPHTASHSAHHSATHN